MKYNDPDFEFDKALIKSMTKIREECAEVKMFPIFFLGEDPETKLTASMQTANITSRDLLKLLKNVVERYERETAV